MRKLFGLLLVIVTCCVAVMSLVGCSENESHATGSADSLQFNVKYYHHKYIHATTPNIPDTTYSIATGFANTTATTRMMPTAAGGKWSTVRTF